jgi:hypothetical protein
MKNKFWMAAVALATLAGSTARAAELPVYELKGFPITRHQVAVLGAVDAQEQSVIPTLMFGGMPASPSQVAILTPRRAVPWVTIAVKPTAVELVSSKK